MPHSKFGWDYPAGVTSNDIEDMFGETEEDERDMETMGDITTEAQPEAQPEAQHTLADYLLARDEELRRMVESGKEQARKSAEERRTRSLENFTRLIENGFTPGLRAALRLGEPQFTDNSDEEHGEYYTKVEASFTYEGETWTLRYWNGGLHLHGPNDYQSTLESDYSSERHGRLYNRSLLDALRDYPEWLTDTQQRDAEQERVEVSAAQKEPEQPKPALYIEGGARGFLRKDQSVVVEMASYGPQYRGTILDFDKRAVLLVMADESRLLINRAQIATIALASREDATNDVPF